MTRKETMYFVLLEFPDANGIEDNISWLRDYRSKVESICDEYCFKIGALCILPGTYLLLFGDLLQKIEAEYHEKGYNPFFEVMRVTLCWEEYIELLKKILERLQSRLENYLKILDQDGPRRRMVSNIFKETVKTKELILIFQLERLCPKEVMKIQDLASILNEKTVELRLSLCQKVEVREL